MTIDASKITCDQYIHHKVGEPRTIAAWLSGFYHGKKNEVLIDTQGFQANLNLGFVGANWGANWRRAPHCSAACVRFDLCTGNFGPSANCSLDSTRYILWSKSP